MPYPSPNLYPPFFPGALEEPRAVPIPRPHISFPPRLVNGSLAMVEQDSPQELRQSVLACLKTPQGSREDAPDYGIPPILFEQLTTEPDVAAVLAAVEQVEPRVRLLSQIEVDEMVENVRIEVQGTAT